jgi:hypothetical protein
MTRDHQHNPDPNENAARIVAGSAAREAANAPEDLAAVDAAWREWSSQIQKADERALTLLRAAFEAGFEAGRGST